MIPYPYSRYMLVSANQFLLTSYYAYVSNEIVMSTMILMVFITSLMLWSVPKEGFREKLDKTAVCSFGSYFVYKVGFDDTVMIGVMLIIISYMVSTEYYLQRDYRKAAITHVIGVHTLGNMTTMYIIWELSNKLM
jgi:hypothetical protein